jgi:hypothetical protein
MDDPSKPAVEEELSFWAAHRFMWLVVATIALALVLVSVSIFLYSVSGTAQLDLSRPGFQSVSDKVERTDTITEYGAFGPVNKETVDQFTKMYDEQASKAKAVDAFNGDPLNPDLLEFGNPTTSVE